MIKTVSFAPPRSARAAKTGDKSAGKTAKAPSPRVEARADEAVAVAAKPAAVQRARATSGSSSAPKTAVKKTSATKNASTPEIAAPAASAPAAKTPVRRATRKADESAATSAEAENEPKSSATPVAASVPAAPLKVKRSRAPKDLALQYGAASETEVAPRVVEKSAPRKRLTRAAKEARSQMLRPDDDVLQRLQQANAVEVKKPATRGRGWVFECGRCGRVSRFQTPGAICECGAIAVRE